MACPLWCQAICGHRADSSILFCQGFSIRNTLINIAVPVLCVWIWTWSSLWLWMCWPCRYQAIHRLRADLLMEHWFVNISVSTCTQISIVDPISCISNLSTLCLCISRPYRSRAIRSHSVWSHNLLLFCLYCSMHSNLDKHCSCSSCFIHTTWPLRCMWMFCPCRCQAIHTLWADHLADYCSATFSVPTF